MPVADRNAEIYSLLIPLVDGRLIVPRSCVAEVIGFQPAAEMTGAPPWYLGLATWNGRNIPLVSFEGCCGHMIPPASSRSRIVVLHAVSPQIDAGYFALISQGFPQLVRVSADVVRRTHREVFPSAARSSASCAWATRRHSFPTSTGSSRWSRKKHP